MQRCVHWDRARLDLQPAPFYGIAEVTVDDGQPQQVDLYSNKVQFQQAVFSLRDLAETTHTVRIEWTGRKRPQSQGTVVRVDALDVGGTLDEAVIPDDGSVKYEQTEDLIVYEGLWSSSSSGSLSGGSDKWADSSAAALNVEFTGTGFHYITTKAPYYGKAALSVDGGEPQVVDLYATAVAYQQRAFTATGLSDTTHTVRIEWLGEKHSSSAGTVIRLDRVDVFGTLAQATIPDDGSVKYEQDEELLVYEGPWSATSNANLSGGTDAWTNSSGGAVDIAFTGTGFHYVSTKAPYYGKASVSVDGGAPVLVDLYAPSVAYQQRAYTVTDLSDTTHTVRIEWAGRRTPPRAARSSGSTVSISLSRVPTSGKVFLERGAALSQGRPRLGPARRLCPKRLEHGMPGHPTRLGFCTGGLREEPFLSSHRESLQAQQRLPSPANRWTPVRTRQPECRTKALPERPWASPRGTSKAGVGRENLPQAE